MSFSFLQFFFVLIPATLCVPCVTFNNLVLRCNSYLHHLTTPVDLLLYIIQDENESRMKKNEI